MTDLEQQLRRPPTAELHRGALTVALAQRAGKASLLDVAYAEIDSPIGELIVFVTPRGLLRVKYADEPIEGVLADVAVRAV
jgi:methylated-DNA-[protein]-cysteine S-methyltransferase